MKAPPTVLSPRGVNTLRNFEVSNVATVSVKPSSPAMSGTAVVGVFHDLNLAAALADELVLLRHGRSMAAGPCSDVLKDDLLSAAHGWRC